MRPGARVSSTVSDNVRMSPQPIKGFERDKTLPLVPGSGTAGGPSTNADLFAVNGIELGHERDETNGDGDCQWRQGLITADDRSHYRSVTLLRRSSIGHLGVGGGLHQTREFVMCQNLAPMPPSACLRSTPPSSISALTS